jgi:hypothetical protein
MNTKKILSIDFDIIMYPCIKLYNSKSSGDANSTQLWEFLEHEININSFLKYDAQTLKDIALLMKRNIQKGAKLYAIQEHQQVVDKLKKMVDYNETKFDITNIDFHHDIWYGPQDITDAKDFDKWACNNWLGYLYSKEKTTNIHWIKGPNSEKMREEENNIINQISGVRNIINQDDDYDIVFFCLSPQWVPYQYHHLYYLIIELITNYSKEEQNNDECNDER